MYGKLFTSMYDGTLVADWRALVVFQQMLVLCDLQGTVDMTPRAISARTGIPLDIIEAGIALLEQPDPYSRTPEKEGRRIERIDGHRPWGWLIVNYRKYRQMMSGEQKRAADRSRLAAKREAEKSATRQSATERDMSQVVASVADVAHAEAEAEASKSRAFARDRVEAQELHREIIAAYHSALPASPRVKAWTRKREGMLRTRIAELVAEGKDADCVDYWRKLFGVVAASDFLSGRAGKFCASLEWIIRPENLLKIREGNYANRRAPGEGVNRG